MTHLFKFVSIVYMRKNSDYMSGVTDECGERFDQIMSSLQDTHIVVAALLVIRWLLQNYFNPNHEVDKKRSDQSDKKE
jgi:hypothetical protein